MFFTVNEISFHMHYLFVGKVLFKFTLSTIMCKRVNYFKIAEFMENNFLPIPRNKPNTDLGFLDQEEIQQCLVTRINI